jgi:hypothetical protein
MKAVEFQSRVNPDQTLTKATSMIDAVPIGQAVRVLILIPENGDDQEWEQLAAEEFGRGYADSDALYVQHGGLRRIGVNLTAGTRETSDSRGSPPNFPGVFRTQGSLSRRFALLT